jgi:hypothetical protein
MLKRKTIILSIAFSLSALLIVVGGYIATFYVFYYDALNKNAVYGLYYIEKGNYKTCSLITEFVYEGRDVWPFEVNQFSAVFHPLIWWNMKNRRKTSKENGMPFDLSQTRNRCIARGVGAEVFDGDLVISFHRNGPVLFKIDYFGTRMIANHATIP